MEYSSQDSHLFCVQLLCDKNIKTLVFGYDLLSYYM
jgi:hypothetical protein